MTILDFSDTNAVCLFTIALFAIVFSRYVLISGLFYILFYTLFKDRFWHRKISRQLRPQGQHWQEIKWSAFTSAIFALSGVLLIWLWQKDYTAIYIELPLSGIGYAIISLFLALLIHETYYYWLHRWMHRPKIYRWIHKTHHDSIVTSPWTSFSFHPMESLLQAIVVPLIVLFLPIHYAMVIILLVIMTISATINHLDIELYPAHFEKHWLGKWIIGATHHSLHHAKFRVNYGLYFTFWDKWMETESPEFEKLFQEKTKSKKIRSYK